MTIEEEMVTNLQLARSLNAGYVVEINAGNGDGWEIAQGPMPRARAREMVKWYRTHTDPGVKARYVATGPAKEEIR